MARLGGKSKESRFVGAVVVGAVVFALAFAGCSPSSSTVTDLRGPVSPSAHRTEPVVPHCPAEMAMVDGRFCIDRWEASLVEVDPEGERPFPPFQVPKDVRVRAVSRPGVLPQAYISREEAAVACAAAGKRLCRGDEWLLACRGKSNKQFPYGHQRQSRACNDDVRISPLKKIFGHLGRRRFGYRPMNDPRLNLVPGTLAKTGSFAECKSDYGVYDLVGNLHEWVDEARSTFRGGYYLDTRVNGDGCEYRTVAHGPTYHDYSTGFRCCADAVPVGSAGLAPISSP